MHVHHITTFTAQHYASTVYAVALSVRPSQVGFLPKWLNTGSRKQCCTIDQGF